MEGGGGGGGFNKALDPHYSLNPKLPSTLNLGRRTLSFRVEEFAA